MIASCQPTLPCQWIAGARVLQSPAATLRSDDQEEMRVLPSLRSCFTFNGPLDPQTHLMQQPDLNLVQEMQISDITRFPCCDPLRLATLPYPFTQAADNGRRSGEPLSQTARRASTCERGSERVSGGERGRENERCTRTCLQQELMTAGI